MEIVHIYGVELSRVMLDNLILWLWTSVFTGIGFFCGRVYEYVKHGQATHLQEDYFNLRLLCCELIDTWYKRGTDGGRLYYNWKQDMSNDITGLERVVGYDDYCEARRD